MEDNYSIDEILSAVDDLQNLKRNKTKKVSSVSIPVRLNVTGHTVTVSLMQRLHRRCRPHPRQRYFIFMRV